jgi:hypothetical protein
MLAAHHCPNLLPQPVTGRTVFAVAVAILLGGSVHGLAQEAAAMFGSRLPPLPPEQSGGLFPTTRLSCFEGSEAKGGGVSKTDY